MLQSHEEGRNCRWRLSLKVFLLFSFQENCCSDVSILYRVGRRNQSRIRNIFLKCINHFQHAREKIFPKKRKTNSVPHNLEGKKRYLVYFAAAKKNWDEKIPSVFLSFLSRKFYQKKENVTCFSSATSSFTKKLVNFFEIQIECKMRGSNGIFFL